MSLAYTVKKMIPRPVFEMLQPAYHFVLALAGALWYWFPSRGMVVIGVTGTKGKTTTANLIAQLLEEPGKRKVGLATTANFRIGDREWVNETKQTMLGRMRLQSLLHSMKKAGCTHAVIETSSEGILQFRHLFINYRIAVFTNVSPEHIERHGSFENYKAAKKKLFDRVARRKNGIGIYNLDDKHAEYFMKGWMPWKMGFSLKGKRKHGTHPRVDEELDISGVTLSPQGTSFYVNGVEFHMPLVGEFNVYNAAAAIAVAHTQEVPLSRMRELLAQARPPAGRFELVTKGQPFTVVVDYAHEPASLAALYDTVKRAGFKSECGKLICLLGSQGGGRDVWKRAALGEVAARACDEIILTNEDPYDEDPRNIIADIKTGVFKQGFSEEAVHEVLERRGAIKKAIQDAKEGDVVAMSGKGGEVWMCVQGGKKIPWSDRAVAEEILEESGYNNGV